MALFEKVNDDIKTAMKERDKVALDTLRNIKKVFLEAKTAPGANDTLEDSDALKMIQKLAKQGKESAQTYIDAGRQDLADAELAQVSVIERYLPEQLSEAEIEKIVKTLIEQTGAASMKDMGKVMGMANKQLAGKADGKTISGIVKKLLA
ncbi:MAG: GatB/YqeY domain-containing protein [Prevotella buccalis]|nr:GatB/YqeY domain-containing protein [Hoylesella buccalis]